MPARQRAARVPVRFDDAVWREAIRGFAGRSLQIATAARTQTEQPGARSERPGCSWHAESASRAIGFRVQVSAGSAALLHRRLKARIRRERRLLQWRLMQFFDFQHEDLAEAPRAGA